MHKDSCKYDKPVYNKGFSTMNFFKHNDKLKLRLLSGALALSVLTSVPYFVCKADEFDKQIAEMKPVYAVFRDASFEDDSANINCEQLFKAISPSTMLKVI